MADYVLPISGIIGIEPTATAEYVREKLAEAAGADLLYTVSSPGGIIYEGLEIFNMIADYKGKTTSKIIGMAASMASVIPLAANRRIAKSNSIVMIHDARLPVFGTAADHRKASEIADGLSNILAEIYAKATGKSVKEMRALMIDETYIYGKSIKNTGFVNEIEETSAAIPVTESKAILDAKAQIALCIDRVNSEKLDLTKAAAILDIKPKNATTTQDAETSETSPDNQAKTNQGANPMNEEQFLAFLASSPEAKTYFDTFQAENRVDFEKISLTDLLAKAPVAKADYEKAVADARTEVEAGRITKEQVGFIARVLESKEYDGSLKATAVKVWTGEKDYSHFEDLVAQEDRFNEKLKSIQVKKEQPGVTKGEQHDPTNVDINKIKAEAKDHGRKIGTVKKED